MAVHAAKPPGDFSIHRRPPALFLSICWDHLSKLLARAGDLVGGISRLQPARFGSYRKRLGVLPYLRSD